MRAKVTFLFLVVQAVTVAAFSQFTLERFYDAYLMERYKRLGELNSVSGYPYVEKEFQLASVKFRGGEILKEHLRYNNYFDEMEMQRDEKIVHLAYSSQIREITIGQTTYHFFAFMDESNQAGQGYFQLVKPGEISLYKRVLIRFFPEKRPSSGYEEYLPPRFEVQKPVYFVRFEKNQPVELPETKKKLENFFSEMGYDVSGILREKKIKMDEHGFVLLLESLEAYN